MAFWQYVILIGGAAVVGLVLMKTWFDLKEAHHKKIMSYHKDDEE